MPAIEALGHVGIYAQDIIKMRDFYSQVLGLEVADQDLDGRGMVFMSADPEREHHEFVLVKGRVTDDDAKVIQQISFIVNSVEDLKEYYLRLKEADVTFDRTVSHGNALGMYFFDPEGNRIELYYRTGFKVPQPHGDPIDMTASVEELLDIARDAIPA